MRRPLASTLVLLFLGALQVTVAWPQAVRPAAEGDRPAAAPGHQGHGRGGNRLLLAGAEGARVTLWRPDLETRPLAVEHGGITLPRTGFDNYHAVVAEKDWGASTETVVRYEYLRGRPSGRSPAELTGAVKAPFEIVPDPLPREHRHYVDGTRWEFILRFQGRPLANRRILVETSNGSRLETVSSGDGRFGFTLPDDFPGRVPGERDRRAAEFQVSSEHEAGGITHQTRLSAEYRVNPSHWRSTPLGVGVAALGFLAGLLLVRRGGRAGSARA